ncbi:uncharacterized protein LOC100837332 [Brachypodium distachyon]|uniref:Uncharacterized protein n=1 Tax=Brachypodium distachyon TaxID=15368 RepID=A0A0Q3H0K3_BRADI|nr:uncharacterized protein LOC100837332 [Brachypodium distachyon]KQK16566.1 hypothetical protein BRADI_1g29287v3 [Brachypodium distachyon]|eukprot:XP_014752376.1 uncharacterized protein LOC100837332 [Brachypodium distachyon]
MAAATSLPCSSSTIPPSLPSPSSSRPLFFLLSNPQRPSRLQLLHIHPRHRRPSIRCCSSASSSSSSYNGWADLPAAAPDDILPFFRVPQSIAAAPLPILLLLVPAAALSLSRLPPLPLLAAAFAAGFATARHLAPGASSSHAHAQRRLASLLADLDARLLSLKKTHSPSPADDGFLQAVDRARDAVRDYAAAVAGQGSTAAPDEGTLGELAREVAGYFGAWVRDTLRELRFTSPRKKPSVKVAAAAAAAAVDADSDAGFDLKNSDAGLVNSGSRDTQAQKANGDDSSSIRPTGSAARPLDMLPFDAKDADDLEDAGFSSQSGQAEDDDRLERLVFKHRYGRGSGAQDNGRFQGRRFATESSLLERTLEIRDRSYRLKIERRSDSDSRVHERSADEFRSNAASVDETTDDEGAAAVDSDGEEFSRNIKEAAEVLRKARECMMARADEETADALLYKSASLLSTAVALRPTSLVAVGQLGNTYLLHGELKLKISRELRTLLANSGAYLNGRERVSRSRKLDRRIVTRENISSALVDVCEECESLLVDAGRSYRTAVSIDSGDVKALYNWGLALIFRAQLLADIGPEAAVDADRVYLAAIDKFDAMLSKSNTYAPEALYRWGSALQQRSQLRSGKNKEKIRLLEQAKSLFEDVLYVEADNKMVREALSSCISELNYHGRWL